MTDEEVVQTASALSMVFEDVIVQYSPSHAPVITARRHNKDWTTQKFKDGTGLAHGGHFSRTAPAVCCDQRSTCPARAKGKCPKLIKK